MSQYIISSVWQMIGEVFAVIVIMCGVISAVVIFGPLINKLLKVNSAL